VAAAWGEGLSLTAPPGGGGGGQPNHNAAVCAELPALQQLWLWLAQPMARQGLGVAEVLGLDAAAARALAPPRPPRPAAAVRMAGRHRRHPCVDG
jgi:hypothetical protein